MGEWLKRRHEAVLCFGLLGAITVVFFLPIFLHPTQMLWASDIVRTHAEYRQVQWRSFHVWGAFPLWDPTVFSGKSIVGDSLPALLNPLGTVFWVVWSPVLFGFYLWIAATLSAWGMFLYARLKGCTALGAFVAAVVFALSGKTAGHLFAGHVELLSAALGLPWLLWAAEHLLQRPRVMNAVRLGVVLTLVATCGSVQMMYWHILFLIAYVAVMAVPQPGRTRRRQVLINELWLAAAGLVFLGCAAAWWFPIARQTFVMSARTTEITRGFATVFSLPLTQLDRFIWPFRDIPLPRTFADDLEMRCFWETAGYPGVAALVFALTAVFALRRSPGVRPAAVLAVLALLLAMGRYSIVYFLAYLLVPGFYLFRAPGRFLFYMNAMVALLAGMLVGRKDSEKRSVLLAAVPLVVLAPVLMGTLSMRDGGTGPERGLWVPVTVLGALSLVSVLYLLRFVPERGWQVAVTAVVVAELLYLWVPHVRMADSEEALPRLSAGEFLAKQAAPGTFRYYDPTGLLQQQDAAHYGLETIDGYHPGIYGHQLDVYRRIWRNDESSLASLETHPLEQVVCPVLLDLLNVRYALSTTPIADANYVEVFRTPPSQDKPVRYVYERRSALPRAWLVARADAPPAGSSVLDALCALNPREACLVAERPVAGTAAYRELRLERRAPGDVTLRFRCDGPGVAVLSDSWHPDWRATDGGNPVEVRRVNHAMLGVVVGPGEHVLRVYYHPWDFFLGLAVSGISWTAVVVTWLCVRRNQRQYTLY